MKAASQGLHAPLAGEVSNAEDYFSEAAKQLLKFHGMYQQHDRDQDGPKTHSFMIRTKVPGGQLSAAQYLAHDRISSDFGNETLRLTTRQCIQFHGILKGDLRDSIRTLHNVLITTLGACGDIVRNVMACPVPSTDPRRRAAQAFADELTLALFPQTRAYHQIWLDGEALIDETPLDEPLYGPTYLPRKFKIGIALPEDNCVDVYTQDIGLVALFDGAETLAGFNLLVGGGMGKTHKMETTFARLADLIGFVTPDQVIETCRAIVTIHRDFGDRENRKHARLKYVLHEWGVERFKAELQQRLSFTLQPPRPMPTLRNVDHLGWNAQGDGRWFLGLPIENGRILDESSKQLRLGLRTTLERFDLGVRLTPQQNILLTDIVEADRPTIEALLYEYNIQTIEQISPVRRLALACPALPTCGLAIAEAERISPQLITEFEQLLDDTGLVGEPIVIRMTGCPNGCARPYVAEIAFVGRSKEKYTIYLGGSFDGERLAVEFLDLVHADDLVPVLAPVLRDYHAHRQTGERFGDYVYRAGIDTLRALVPQPVGEAVGD
ncbi:MAG: NADPH-dependent assimilatory sulfite reductase hemoprotein subunit [Chloroflexi bacterium]|nr:NADPH-dependent assimilatory sulfite reductase hemoprotein subunit [Chloroflexota bacterium]